MTVSAPVAISRTFQVNAGPDEVFRLLANVGDSIAYFPNIIRFEDLGGGVYQREMEKTGLQGISVQIVYASRYVTDPAQRSITWMPVPGVGNGQISGRWQIRPRPDGGSHLEFTTSGVFELPVPWLLASVAKPFTAKRFASTIDTYLQNLTYAFGGTSCHDAAGHR